MRTLYLLGNGFDLACGLKSRYADYFESRFKWYKGYNSSDSKAIPAIYKEIQDGGIKNIPSAWFIVFAYEHDQPGYRNDYVLWKDIEKNIDTFLQDYPQENEISISEYFKYFSNSTENTPPQKKSMYELLTLYFQKKDIAFRTEENLFDIFDQELSNLENDFAKYLRTIDQNPNYQANAKLLFEKIQKAETSKRIEYVTFGTIGGHMSSMPKEPHEEFVMSFNYTRPLEDIPNYVNLHGEENQGTAMFGIADDNGYPTKTEMKITSGYRSSFFKDTRRQQKECLDRQSARTINELSKKQIDEIKCFGCSFSDADFDYFRRYFNLAKFDKSDSTLGIYYTNGISRKSAIKDLRKLLNKYDLAHESDNNNTYQTLENSGRISFEEIQLPLSNTK